MNTQRPLTQLIQVDLGDEIIEGEAVYQIGDTVYYVDRTTRDIKTCQLVEIVNLADLTNTESERVPNLADAIPTNTDAVQADPNHQPLLVKFPPRPETYVLEHASDGIMWRIYHSPTNGSLCLSFSTSGDHHPELKTHMAQFAVGEIVHIPTGQGRIVDILTKQASDNQLIRVFTYIAYEVFDSRVNTTYWFSEAQLLDYDNPRDIHANVVTKAYDYHYQRGFLLFDESEDK